MKKICALMLTAAVLLSGCNKGNDNSEVIETVGEATVVKSETSAVKITSIKQATSENVPEATVVQPKPESYIVSDDLIVIRGTEYSTDKERISIWEKDLTNEDIVPLSKMKNLISLDLGMDRPVDTGTPQLTDLTPLQNLTSLKTLEIGNNKISDLTPLQNLTSLETLNIQRNEVSDLTPLQDLTSLKKLNLRKNNISDLTPLKNLTSLENLNLSINQISDLSPLVDLTSLANLNLDGNLISDITPLKKITSLKYWNLVENNISNTAQFKGADHVLSIDVWKNQINDVAPFAELTSLRSLGLINNNIKDITPLTNSSTITGLRLEGNPIEDYMPLLEMQALSVLYIDRYNNRSTKENPKENPFNNLALPDNPTNWQSAYADYLKNRYSDKWWPHSVYVRDINFDGIPEVFLYHWDYWNYPQEILTYTENGLVETHFDYYTSTSGCCYLYLIEETGQLLVKETGHTTGTMGMLDYFLYNSTSSGYEVSLSLEGCTDGYFDYPDGSGDGAFYRDMYKCRINKEEVSYEEFTAAVEKNISPLNLKSFNPEMMIANREETSEYLNNALFYIVD